VPEESIDISKSLLPHMHQQLLEVFWGQKRWSSVVHFVEFDSGKWIATDNLKLQCSVEHCLQ
jgi:hypothetical protein